MDGRQPYMGMLEVTVRVYLPVPRSMSKRNAAFALAGAIRPVTRPDCDNYSKSILDALTGLAWVDDSQIVQLNIGKFYSEKPRVEIEVMERAFPNSQKELFK
jgi:Holliday junction resolvase RusA-like endonuclease